jgi:adenylate cyclase
MLGTNRDIKTLRFIPDIRYGTEGYPEKVARRLRAVNFTAWCSAAFAAMYAISQLFDPTPGIWKVAVANTTAAVLLVLVPLLHRFGPLAAPLAFMVLAYTGIFIICSFGGTATGMPMQYLAVAALSVLFFGSERLIFSIVFGALAAVLMIVLEITVPRDTGLLPPSTLFVNFIGSIVGTSAILLAVVFYAVREIDRAEGVAEHEFARSEKLLANILPASVG